MATSVKDGGDQVEYEDQDPRIHRMFLDELKGNGGVSRMGKYFNEDGSSKIVAR